jgi:hypothetical protein
VVKEVKVSLSLASRFLMMFEPARLELISTPWIYSNSWVVSPASML